MWVFLLVPAAALLRGPTVLVDQPQNQSGNHAFWLHIPKTGTSFGMTVLRYGCPEGALEDKQLPICADGDQSCNVMPKFVKQLTKEKACPCAVAAFGPDGLQALNSHRPLKTAVDASNGMGLFRDPLQRMLSGFHHDQHGARDMGKLDAVSYARDQEGLQTKYLWGKIPAKGCLDSDFCRQGKIQEAITSMNQMAFVGITDKWDLSICLFHTKFGGHCLQDEFGNTRPNPERDSDSYRYDESVLHGWTDRYDGPLYEAVLERFEKDIADNKVTPESCAQLCPYENLRFE